MAWRPHQQLIEGLLDNTIPGKVTGWLRFVGVSEEVRLDLVGDFHRDIRGASIRLLKDSPTVGSERSMEGFSTLQAGAVGDITAGLEPTDYVRYPYIEWYSIENGRVVLELEPFEVQVLGTPIPFENEEPLDQVKQMENMQRFLAEVSESIGVPCETEKSGTEDVGPDSQVNNVGTPKFQTGSIYATAGVNRQIPSLEVLAALGRHSRGDWGIVCDEDRAENELSLAEGFRIVSHYEARDGTPFWVITEADRSSTTVLLPEEY